MDDEQLPVRARIGYCNPPAEHRFKKGQSGNPGGRPKRAHTKPKEIKTGFGIKAAEEYLRAEAYRPVMIREGEQVIELPAIQAVFRAMGVSAMKGNRFAQKSLAEMVAKMEAEQFASKLELFGTMLEYKHKWEQERLRLKRLGISEPEPIPHPDDIILDPHTGDVQVLGPQTKEQKLQLEELLVRRTGAQDEVNFYAEKYRRVRDPDQKARWLKEWHFEQRIFDIINDAVGPRYKAKLENRSWAEGASQEGETLKKYMRKSKLQSD